MKEGFMFVTGLLLTMGAVGADDSAPFLDIIVVALVGLGIMLCSVLMMQASEDLDN